MANFTAADVNNLRKTTGAGMMDCKNALVEADGDAEKAIEILRKTGQKVAAKRGGRDACEGLAMAKTRADNKKGVLLVLNCETDFVAKNEGFNSFVNKLVDLAITNDVSTLEELKALSFEGNGVSVADRIIEEVGKIGEKLEISTFEVINSESVVAYNHPGNQIASLVGLNKESDMANEAGKDVAMQVAAMAPLGLDKDDIPQEVVNKEIEIGKEQAIAEGKPAELAEKIALGKLNKFYKESTLLNQDFIKESKKSVSQYLKDTEDGLTITQFKRASLN